MPATQIIDLDAILGDDKQVRLAGKTYKLPPDIPVALYLKINKFSQEENPDMDLIEMLYRELVKLFQYGDPKLQELPIGVTQAVQAIQVIYGAPDAEGNGQGPPPTRGGKTSSTRSRKSAS